MHTELENLINMALADGEVTEKERGIIMRKAEALGEDKDEVEMILDGRIAMMIKEQTVSQAQHQVQKTNKEGDVKKCPSCGAPVESFKTKCADCGHEYRGSKSSNSASQLFVELTKIEDEERNRPREKVSFFNIDGGNFYMEQSIANRISTTVSSFPVPNTKEDIFEFLAVALPQTKIKLQKLMFKTAPIDRPKEIIKNAWQSKCEQVIMKARMSMKDDRKTLEEIEVYAKQLGIK